MSLAPYSPRKRDRFRGLFGGTRSASAQSQTSATSPRTPSPIPAASAPSPIPTLTPVSTVSVPSPLPAISTSSPVPTVSVPSQIPPEPRISSSILADALEALNHEDRVVIRSLLPENAFSVGVAVQGAHDLATELQQQCAIERLSWQYRGRQIYLSDHMSKVLQLLDKVKSAGDVAVSADPIHAGLPWAGLRIILEVCQVWLNKPSTVN